MNARQIQYAMQLLRNVAEVDPNDQIANACASLAYRLEAAGTSVFDMSDNPQQWSEVDQAALQYAISKRDKYQLLPGAKHACIVS